MMADAAKFLNLFLNVGLLSVVAGVGVTLGCMAVCKALSWAPINITVNNYGPRPAETANPGQSDEVAA